MGQLKAWRTAVVDRDAVPLVMVLSNSQLKAIAGYRPQSVEELGGLQELRAWQVTRYGAELVNAVLAFEEDLRAPAKRKRRRNRKRSTSE